MTIGMLAFSMSALPVMAQQAPVGVETLSSEAGKVSATQAIKASVLVTAIDKTTRTITVKNDKGQVFDIIAGDDVRNFDQIKVGDSVVAAYVRALTMQVTKPGVVREQSESTDGVRAAPGQKPGGAVGRTVHTVVNVMAVDPKAMTITVKGPKGNVFDLAVHNPDHFKVVKKGDQIAIDYTEAVAIAVEAAPPKADKKPAKK